MKLDPASRYQAILDKCYQMLPVLGVCVGVALRLRNYLENRSFGIDEAWTSLEVVSRSFQEIINHDYIFEVSSRPPTGFLLIQKFPTLLFGNNEMVLRLFPLLCGVSALLVFYKLAQRHLTPLALAIAVWLFALAEPLVYYSAEAKRYSTTLLSALIFWYLAPYFFARPFSKRKALVLALAGAFIIWLAHVSIFVLASILIVMTLTFLVQKRWKEVVYLLIAEVFIGVNFTVILNSSLKGMIDNPEMENLWQGALWNGNVFSFEALKWAPQVIYASIMRPCGLGFPILVMILVVMGALAWGSRSRRDMALFALPVALAFAAALFGKYPFQGRTILFLAPAYYLFLSQGLDFIAQRFLKIKGVLLAVMLLLVFMRPVQEAVFFLSGNRLDTYSHELLKYFGDHYLPGDAIFVTVDTKYSFWYYAGSLGYGKRFVKEPCCRKDQRILEGIKIGLFSIDPIKYVGDSSYKSFVLEKMKKIMFLYQYDVFDEHGNFKGSFIHEDERTYSVSADGNNQYPHSGRVWLFLNKHEDAKKNEGLNIIVASFRKEGKELFNMERPSRVLYLFDMDQRQPIEAPGSPVNLINFQVPAS